MVSCKIRPYVIDDFMIYANKDVLPVRYSITGKKMLRPDKKLTELVAESIRNSPDGLLQAKQVYQAVK